MKGPCKVYRIWGLKQYTLQVNINGHAWVHLLLLRPPVRNGKQAKNKNICLHQESNQQPLVFQAGALNHWTTRKVNEL